MSRVLVTGANGFVGKELCALLSRAGYEVCGVVRFLGATPSAVCDEVVVDEIGPDTNWREALEGIDYVIHLAARVHIMQESYKDPDESFRCVNTDGSRHLAEQAVAAGIRRFIYVSSIKVNGEETVQHPFTESDVPDPQDAYGRSKLAAERALFEVTGGTGMELVVVRPPLIYGPGVKGNMLRLLRWVARGYPLPFGAIYNHRSLIALENFVDLLVCCLEHPSAAGQIFLAADGTELSTPDLIRSLAHALNRKAFLVSLPPVVLQFLAKVVGRDAEVARLLGSLRVDASKAEEILDWRPPITPDQAMSSMAKWFQRSRR